MSKKKQKIKLDIDNSKDFTQKNKINFAKYINIYNVEIEYYNADNSIDYLMKLAIALLKRTKKK